MLSLTHFLQRAAKVNGGGTATIYGDRQRNWDEVLDRVQRTAALLRQQGVVDEQRVAILGPNSDTYLEYLFAVAWAGGVIVPINTRLAAAEIIEWIEDSGAEILVVDEPFVDTIVQLRDQIPQIREVIQLGAAEIRENHIGHEEQIAALQPVEDAGRGDDDLYALFYTGGTTGRSKGVMITHGGLYINTLGWITAVRVSMQDRFLVIPPMFHAAGGENSIAVVALAATACFIPAFDVEAALGLVEEHKLTKIPLVATMLDMMISHPNIGNYDLSSVRKITYGASPIHEDLLRRAMRALPEAEFFQVFGQTEGGPTVTVLPPEYHVSEGPMSGKLKSAGIPVIGQEITILDADGKELEPGIAGEICVRGPGVSPGYWNLPEISEAAFYRGWLRTGDAGFIDEDGFLTISDRVKDMIISGGENVYPAETERALLGHPAVAECAVIGIPSEKWGEQVHAIVRLAPDQSVEEDALIKHCRDQLAGYKCPRSIEFRSEPFPLTAAAKVLKRELRKPYWDGES